MIDFRHNTAGQAKLLGAFLNVSDISPATGLTIANTDIRILKPGASAEVAKNSGGALHVAGGRYIATFDATDTDTIGNGEINIAMSGALPVRRAFRVLSQARYDQEYGTTAYSTYAGGPVESVTNPVLVQATSVRAALGLTSANLTELLEAIPTTAPMTAEAVKAATLQAIEEFGPAKPGAEMGLLGTTIGMVADAVQVGFLDDEDGHAIINTIVGAIGNQNIDELALVAAIRAELERTTGPLGLLFDRLPEARAALIDKLNVAGTLAHTGNAGLFQADTNGLLTLAAFNAALPANFSGLTIDPESGGIPASNLDTITIDISGLEVQALTDDQAAALVRIDEKTSLIGTGQARWVEAGFSRGGDLRIVRGDSYGVAGGWPALTIVDRGDEWPDLTGATLRLTLRAVRRRDVEPPVLLTAAGTVGEVDGHQAALFTVEAGQTTALTPGTVQYDVEATWGASGAVATIVGPDAAGMVLFDQSPPPE